MNYSAQAIIIDYDWNIYLERNHVIKSLSFVWGKVEEGEDYEWALKRELKEELGILPQDYQLWNWEIQPTRKFWNERKWQEVEWTSKYFICLLPNILKLPTELEIKLEVFTLQELRGLSDENFPSARKKEFLAQVERALSHI